MSDQNVDEVSAPGATRLAPERRAALAAATVAEFSRAGYEAASLNRIIRGAGMSKSSFYHFVGSKSELFDAVVRMLVADLAGQWEPPRPSQFADGDFWVHVDELMAQFVRLAESPSLQHLGRIFYLHGDSADIGDPADVGARAELLDRVRSWVEAVLRAGRETGQVRDDLPDDLQADVVFAVLRAIDEWAVTAPVERAEVAASAPLAVLRRLLAT